MKTLDRDVCRLVVEAGLAAVNHGFMQDAETIRAALPFLTSNESAARLVDATLLFGMGQRQEALDRLSRDASDEAAALRCWITGEKAPPPQDATTPAAALLAALAHPRAR